MGRAGKRKSKRGAQFPAASEERPPIVTRAQAAFLLGILILSVAAIAWAFNWSRTPVDSPAAVRRTRVDGMDAPGVALSAGPRTLEELLALEPAKLATLDIARVNLLCAQNLPGAEQIDLEHCLGQLDLWAELVGSETDRHFYSFRRNPAEYENSEGYFRMLMLVTVLQQDLGVHYNMDRVRDVNFSNSKDLFIHGMIPARGVPPQQTNGGTCASMVS